MRSGFFGVVMALSALVLPSPLSRRGRPTGWPSRVAARGSGVAGDRPGAAPQGVLARILY
jgi:hypothetical protein